MGSHTSMGSSSISCKSQPVWCVVLHASLRLSLVWPLNLGSDLTLSTVFLTDLSLKHLQRAGGPARQAAGGGHAQALAKPQQPLQPMENLLPQGIGRWGNLVHQPPGCLPLSAGPERKAVTTDSSGVAAYVCCCLLLTQICSSKIPVWPSGTSVSCLRGQHMHSA